MSKLGVARSQQSSVDPSPTSGANSGPWVFPSSSAPDKSYTVSQDGSGDLVCDCPGFRFRRECKHAAEVTTYRRTIVRAGSPSAAPKHSKARQPTNQTAVESRSNSRKGGGKRQAPAAQATALSVKVAGKKPIERSRVKNPGKTADSPSVDLLTNEAYVKSVTARAKEVRTLLEGERRKFKEPTFLYSGSSQWEIVRSLDLFISALLRISWMIPIDYKSVPLREVDRVGPILLGPLYTSGKYPWPQKEGVYLEPIAQFDLESIGTLGDVELGSGLLQLWLGPGFMDSFIRVVPKASVNRSLMSPIPDDIYRDSKKLATGSCHWGSWLDKKPECLVIAATRPRVMTWPERLSNRAALDSLPANCRDAVRDFAAALPNCKPPHSASDAHFLGCFLPVQYELEDVPPCLLAIESFGDFTWGDCGNAQILYQRINGVVSFEFVWSCT